MNFEALIAIINNSKNNDSTTNNSTINNGIDGKVLTFTISTISFLLGLIVKI